MSLGDFRSRYYLLRAESTSPSESSSSNNLLSSNSPAALNASSTINTSNEVTKQQPVNKFIFIDKWRANALSVIGNLKFESLVAGVTGGVLSTLVLHPLDLLKIRFAVNDGRLSIRPHYLNLREGIRTIFQQEGIAGFYRGTVPNLMGAGVSWGLYFLFYNCVKDYMLDTRKELTPWLHLLAAGEAGVLTVFITNPLWVVKTRLCLQYGSQHQLIHNLPTHKVYSGTRDAFYKIYKYEGVRGLYKGVVPGLFGVAHGSLQFMVYEELKKRINKRRNVPIETKLDNYEYIMCAAISKLIAASITFPYQVVRARLQDQHTDFKGVRDVIVRTWRNEGVRGFYKGLTPSLLRVVPQTSITLVVYENTIRFLNTRNDMSR